eukprot:4995771-Amphidinium_carterae.3
MKKTVCAMLMFPPKGRRRCRIRTMLVSSILPSDRRSVVIVQPQVGSVDADACTITRIASKGQGQQR